MSEHGEKPEVLPGDLISKPGVYMSRSNCAVEVRDDGGGYWKADWEDGVRWYYSSGIQTGLKTPNDPYQLVRWVGPLAEDIPTTSEQIAEIEEQAADYTPPKGWRVLQPGEPLQPGDAWAHPQADLFEESLNLTGVAGKHGYYLRRQVCEGRWRTRGGEIRNVTRTPDDHDLCGRFPWSDASFRNTWRYDGRYTNERQSVFDLVEYLGPSEPEPEQTITPDDVAGFVGQQLIRGLVLQVAEAIEATEQPEPQPVQIREESCPQLHPWLRTPPEQQPEPQPEPQPEQAPQAESDFEVRIRVLKQCNDNQAETIGQLQDEVRDLRTELAEATQERYAQTARIGHLEAINSTHAETISGLHSEIHGLNMEIGGLNRERAQKDDRIGYLETLNAGQAAAVRAAGEQNTQLRTLADNARQQLEAAADEISELRKSLDNAEKQLDQKDARIRDLQIELDAAQQVPKPLTDEQQELIWNQATQEAGEQLIRWLDPLVHALKQQPNERFLAFMSITLSVLPEIVPQLLGYEEDEQGEDAEE